MSNVGEWSEYKLHCLETSHFKVRQGKPVKQVGCRYADLIGRYVCCIDFMQPSLPECYELFTPLTVSAFVNEDNLGRTQQ